jgi:hypothetical protein
MGTEVNTTDLLSGWIQDYQPDRHSGDTQALGEQSLLLLVRAMARQAAREAFEVSTTVELSDDQPRTAEHAA